MMTVSLSMTQQIFVAVRDAAGALSIREIERCAGAFEHEAIRNAVKRLITAHKLQRLGSRQRSRYCLVPGATMPGDGRGRGG